VLTRELRAACTARLAENTAERVVLRGRQALRRVPHLDESLATALEDLPIDARTGQRLLALAQLLDVHHELAARARAARIELRRRLFVPTKDGTAVASPRPPRRR
jgi:hypothetical protein